MRRFNFRMILVLVSAFSSSGALFAQDAKMIDAAKKEGGKVVV